MYMRNIKNFSVFHKSDNYYIDADHLKQLYLSQYLSQISTVACNQT